MKFIDMKQMFILLLILIPIHSASAQTASQFNILIKKDIKEVHKSKGKTFINVFSYNDYIVAVPNAILSKLPEYEFDTLTSVRDFVYKMYYKLIKSNNNNYIRQQALNHLINACKDPNINLRTNYSKLLTHIKKDDFSKEAKKQLISFLYEGKDIFKNTVQLIGFLEMKNQIPKLYELLNDATIDDPKIYWKIHLTLARLGEKNEILYCTNLARSKGVNDRIIHFFLKDLVYIRKKEAFDYLIKILNSNEKNCHSPNPYLENNIVCGYRIMELLAPAVKDFPFEIAAGTSSLKVNNYDKALEDVKKWFKEHPDYQIRTDNY